MDPLSAVFLGCFVFGFVAVLASFVLGGLHGIDIGGQHLDIGAGHHGIHLDLGGGHHVGVGAHGHVGDLEAHGASQVGHAAHGGHGVHAEGQAGLFPVNPTTVLAFLTWFGGAGFILRNYYGVVAGMSLALAALVGLVGAGAVFLFLLKVLLPHQTVMHEADYDPVGSVGRVSSPVRAGGVGEVVYVRGGTRRSVGARSLDGRALERGTEVVIAKYERGLAYVQPWDEFVSRERPDKVGAEGNE